MDARIGRNRRLLTDLFSGPFPGHAIIMGPPVPEAPHPGDLACPGTPLTDWLDRGLRDYELQLQYLEALDDHAVPSARIHTGTQIFAAAFGCPVHIYEDSPPAALPLVATAEEADALEVPSLEAEPLARCMEYGRMLRERLGPDAPIRVPDLQSPFDIAALIWKKEAFYLALLDDPAAVRRLVGKCQTLLEGFLRAFIAEFSDCNLCHCPTAWAPPELGCWLSEDEAGAMSVAMFEDFCVPTLACLSESFGGIFIHCCATADHQYSSFRKIPNLRGLNRVFQAPGPQPAIEAFSGQTVLMMAWMTEAQLGELLDMALPDTRYLFDMSGLDLETARGVHERLRRRCGG